jgi:hypothetical protein
MNQIQVLDQNGKILLSSAVSVDHTNILDVSTLATGIYTIRLRNQSQTLNKRFIKQ